MEVFLEKINQLKFRILHSTEYVYIHQVRSNTTNSPVIKDDMIKILSGVFFIHFLSYFLSTLTKYCL